MPKELVELTMFNRGTICNPSVTDIPLEAASDSLNIDPIAEDGKLKGIPTDLKLEDNVGHEKNVLLQNITDSTKHDLISYKNSNNTIYKAEDIYSGSSTESSLGALTASTDEVAMEVMEGAVYLGQGTGSGEEPQWIGRIDHGQFGSTPSDELVMSEDTLYPPNMFNETTTACSDGLHLYLADAGMQGTYSDQQATIESSLKYSSGEITKIKISDGTVVSRSKNVLGYICGICTSSDKKDIWVLASEKWKIAYWNDNMEQNQTFLIYRLRASDLEVIDTYTNNINEIIKTNREGQQHWETLDNAAGGDATSNKWNFMDSYWDGASEKEYHGSFSDILEVNNSGTRNIWICTTAAAVFRATLVDGSTELTFSDKTSLGLGYQHDSENRTENWLPPGSGENNITGGWYTDTDYDVWRFPECFNASLMQLSNTDATVGVYFRNGYSASNLYFKTASGDLDITPGMSLIFVPSHNALAGGNLLNGSLSGGDSGGMLYYLDDASLRSGTNGIREINNMMYKSPYDVLKSAYAVVKDWQTGSMEINIAEFDNPQYDDVHCGPISVKIVEDDDTTQIPIRISNTSIIGIPSDVNLPVSDGNSSSVSVRNQFRKLNKYTTTDNWETSTGDDASIRTQFGAPLFLSQRHGKDSTRSDEGKVRQNNTSSSFHQADAGYFYRYSFIYDGFQESPLGAARHIWSTGKQVELPFTFNTDNLPARVTGIRIYRATSISTTDRKIGGFYHFMGEIDLTTSEELNLDNDNSYQNGIAYAINEADESAGNFRMVSFTDSGPSGATYETMSGLFEGMTDSNVQYKLSTQINNSLFIANCTHHSQDTGSNILYKSLPYKPSLINWALDFLKLPFVPTAIQAFNGRVYVFNENETLKIDPNNMYIEDAFNGAGCLSPDSVAISDFGMCYCDNNNIYINNGQQPVPIGDSILTGDAGRGYLDLLNTSSYSPKVIFDSKRKCFIVYLTSTLAWAYNVIRQSWNIWSNPNLIGVLNGKKGEVLGIDNSGGDLYQMYSSTTLKDDWYWLSKRISMQHKTQKKKFYEATVAYTGDGSGDTPTVSVYYDYSTDSTATTDGGSESNIVKRDLSKEKKRLIQLKVEPGDSSTEVDSIGITFRRFRNLVEVS